MSLRIIENFDGSFQLQPESQQILFELLTNTAFLEQVCQQVSCPDLEFTGKLFQPVPYSTTTPKGMPQEFEVYHDSEEYFIINVPPNFMAQAKIFKPSRLCGIYRRRQSE